MVENTVVYDSRKGLGIPDVLRPLLTCTPFPVYWCDGTFAIVRWGSVPVGVLRQYCAERLDVAIYASSGSFLAPPGTRQDYPHATPHRPDPIYDRFFCKVFIADMLAAYGALVDGLTKAACFERYKENMRAERGRGVHRLMSPAQKAVAQEMWASELRTKTKSAEIKERERVLVDREYEDYE